MHISECHRELSATESASASGNAAYLRTDVAHESLACGGVKSSASRIGVLSSPSEKPGAEDEDGNEMAAASRSLLLVLLCRCERPRPIVRQAGRQAGTSQQQQQQI